MKNVPAKPPNTRHFFFSVAVVCRAIVFALYVFAGSMIFALYVFAGSMIFARMTQHGVIKP
jgi:membrane protease YdiL (CAAX protease family)